MFHILLEVGAERKAPKLGTSILKRLTGLQKQKQKIKEAHTTL